MGCDPNRLSDLVFGSRCENGGDHEPSAITSELREHIDNCARCRSELTELTELFAATMATCEPVAPATAVRDRLMRSLETGRFSQFTARIAELFDVTRERAGELLDWIDTAARSEGTDRTGSDGASCWEPGPSATSALLHFPGGPACAGADTGFVRVAAGSTFPAHSHNGDETNLVLQGSCIDSDGTTYERGDLFCNRLGTHHSFTASPGDVDYIFAVRVFDGVCFRAQDPVQDQVQSEDKNECSDCKED